MRNTGMKIYTYIVSFLFFRTLAYSLFLRYEESGEENRNIEAKPPNFTANRLMLYKEKDNVDEKPHHYFTATN